MEAGTGFDPVLALKNTDTGTGDSQCTMRMDASEGDRFQLRHNNASKLVVNTPGYLVVGTERHPEVELHIKDPGFAYAMIEDGPGNDPVLALKNTGTGGGDSQWTMRMDGSENDRWQLRHNNSSKMVTLYILQLNEENQSLKSEIKEIHTFTNSKY